MYKHQKPQEKQRSFVFAPILIWFGILLMVAYFIAPLVGDTDSESYFVVILVFSLFERFGTAIGTLGLVREWNLNQNLWPILALIFGLNQLLFLNIAIWIKSADNYEHTKS
jgi:hypothetical protein